MAPAQSNGWSRSDIALDFLVKLAIGEPMSDGIDLLDARPTQRDAGKVVHALARHALDLRDGPRPRTRFAEYFVIQYRDLVGADDHRVRVPGRDVRAFSSARRCTRACGDSPGSGVSSMPLVAVANGRPRRSSIRAL